MSDTFPEWMPGEDVWAPNDGVRDSRRIYLSGSQGYARSVIVAHIRSFVEMTAHLPAEWPVNGDLSVEFPTALPEES